MSGKIEISRELVEEIISRGANRIFLSLRIVDELRALLAAQVGDRQPVAWKTGSIIWSYKADATKHGDEHGFEVIPLYTSLPAPVAVVLPDPLDSRVMGRYGHGWNACLDKVKELNQ